MERYLHKFENESDFNAEYNDDSKYIEPWVSYTLDIERVDYNKREQPATYSRTITYVDRGNSTTVTDTQSGPVGSPIPFTIKPLPSWDSEHGCIGWSTAEYPTYAQTQQSGFLKQAGDIFNTSEDITLYADYNITFQGLINEGYVTLGIAEGTSNVTIKVAPNGYPKELVTDFMDVFDSAEGKIVSSQGIVGEGTTKNVFYFPTLSDSAPFTAHTWNYWLTPDEWYDLFNNTTLKYYTCSNQFYGMDWSNKDEVTIIYSGGSLNSIGRTMFGPEMPRILNVNLLGGGFRYMFQTFGNSSYSYGCGSEIINVTAQNGQPATALNEKGSNRGFNALFEGCANLKEFHTLNPTNVRGFGYMFDGCGSIETIPSADLGNEILPSDVPQMFCNCENLEEIETVINVSALTTTTSAFYNCSSLQTLYLKGINAELNVNNVATHYVQNTAVTWELKDTKISQSCADYIVANLTTYTPPQDFTYKVINFPNTITLTGQQIQTLRDNGWEPWINNVPVN